MSDAPGICHNAHPQVGCLVGAVNLQNSTMASNMILHTPPNTQQVEKRFLKILNCKFGLKCGENIRKLSDAPSFCHTASPQVGSGWGSKPSKQYYGFKYDLTYTTQYSTGREKVSKNFKLQIWAKMW